MGEQDSKKQILKSTGILGSVQVVNILLGVIRVKVLAILLGPAGVGIAGIYQTTISLIGSATGLGINFSGVRDIAAAAASNDINRIGKATLVLRRWSWFTGLLGMVLALLFCKPLSRLAFGSESYAWGIAVLSVTLLLSAVTGGMSALLQGMRKIGDLARANVIGAILGMVVAISIYYFFGVNGIVPALFVTFLLSQRITWHFARKIHVPKVDLSLKETFTEGKAMVKLGFFMVIAGIVGNGTMYLVRSFIVQEEGLKSVGHFIAAWTISSMYISAIFNAMGTDYYPRLTALQNDNLSVTKLVNEQTEIALLLTAPIIVGMISFINLVVRIFYSKDFGATSEILNWQLFGDFFKVLSWPMGFVLPAKAKGKLFVLTEFAWNILYLGFVYFGWGIFGFEVLGMGFLIGNIVNLILMYVITTRLVNFKWSSNVWRYIFFFLPILILSFLNLRFVNQDWQYVVGSLLTICAAVFSLSHLKGMINFHAILRKIGLKTTSN